jgi:hypothetical protein
MSPSRKKKHLTARVWNHLFSSIITSHLRKLHGVRAPPQPHHNKWLEVDAGLSPTLQRCEFGHLPTSKELSLPPWGPPLLSRGSSDLNFGDKVWRCSCKRDNIVIRIMILQYDSTTLQAKLSETEKKDIWFYLVESKILRKFIFYGSRRL